RDSIKITAKHWLLVLFFSSRRRHTRSDRDWSSDVCSSDLKKGGWTGPVVSPDGRSVAFTGHEYGTFSYRADEVWTVGIDGSGMRALTTYDRDPGGVRWSPDGSGVFFALAEQGTSNVYFAGLRGGNRKVTDGDQMVSLASVARDFTAVGVRSDATNPPDVARFSLKAGARSPVTRLTSVNADVLDRIR